MVRRGISDLFRRATQTVFEDGRSSARIMHRRPLPSGIGACLPWLHREIELVRPQVIVCLGATASQALFGSGFSVTREPGARDEAFHRFLADLAIAGGAPLDRART